MGYQLKIGRGTLLHEASLRYPIADTLTAGDINIKCVVLEKLHPFFKSKKMDLALFSVPVDKPDRSDNFKYISEFYEFKLAKYSTSEEKGVEHQRVLNDVLRLGYCNKWGGKDAYMMMCGEFDDFRTYFVGHMDKVPNISDKKVTVVNTRTITDTWDSKGLYADWFGFSLNEIREPEFDDTDKKWGLSVFNDTYKIRYPKKHDYSKVIKIRTTCMAITLPDENTRTHAAGIWKIEML